MHCRGILLDAEQPQRIGESIDCLHARFGKPELRTGDEIAHGERDQHFLWSRGRRHLRSDMQRKPADFLLANLQFAGVNRAFELEADLMGRFLQRHREPHRACRPIE